VTAYLFEIRSIIRDFLRDDEVEVEAGTRFEDLLGWNSNDIVEVVTEVECLFDLQFAMVEIDRLDTIDDLSRMITSKLALAVA
jgi:acyl carrier protein